MTGSCRLPARRRIRERWRFTQMARQAERRHGSHFTLWLAASPNDASPNGETRLGIAVSKKVGGAVQRNRVKRWVREVFRCQQASLPRGLDLVVVAKAGAASVGLRETERQLLACIASRRVRTSD